MKQMRKPEQENFDLQELDPDIQVDSEMSDSAADVDRSTERITALQKEIDELKDKWLRSVADNDNYKKRVRREISDAVFRAQQSLLASFLPTVDNLDRALALAVGHDQLAKGIQMVLSEFMSALAKQGIEPVASVGTPFDPSIHDALQQVHSAEHSPGMVVQEFEKGFRMGDKLLRPARVVIASAESTGKSNTEGSRPAASGESN